MFQDAESLKTMWPVHSLKRLEAMDFQNMYSTAQSCWVLLLPELAIALWQREKLHISRTLRKRLKWLCAQWQDKGGPQSQVGQWGGQNRAGKGQYRKKGNE